MPKQKRHARKRSRVTASPEAIARLAMYGEWMSRFVRLLDQLALMTIELKRMKDDGDL